MTPLLKQFEKKKRSQNIFSQSYPKIIPFFPPVSLGFPGMLILSFFFVPMPCALEAQTVIKTFCLWLAIPTYWRIGEKESKVSAETKKQNKQNTATKHKQKDNDPRHLAIESETLRFQKYPLVSQYCTTTK